LAALLLFGFTACSSGGGGGSNGGNNGGGVNPTGETSSGGVAFTRPRSGQSGVGVTRETVVRFAEPVDEDTVDEDSFFASFAGAKLEAQRHVSPDGLTAYLFWTENPLPGNAVIRVTLDGDLIETREGEPLDADDDGDPGGVRSFDFSTLGTAPVPGTRMRGQLVSSQLSETGAEQFLEGAILNVPGIEGEVETDSDGRFTFPEMTAGGLFLRIDGSSISGPPADLQFSVLSQRLDVPPGTDTNLGRIRLPGLWKPSKKTVTNNPKKVSLDEDQLAVFAANPELEADLARALVTVPGDSLFDESGETGGAVGLGAFDVSRVDPAPPEELGLALLFRLETDGPTNFDEPAPVILPNLRHAQTGLRLPGKAKASLWAYDEDAGEYDILGSVTVSSNGQEVSTDAGVGLRAPSWFGVSQSVTVSTSPPLVDVSDCPGVTDFGFDIGWQMLEMAEACQDSIDTGVASFAELKPGRNRINTADNELSVLELLWQLGNLTCEGADEGFADMLAAVDQAEIEWARFAGLGVSGDAKLAALCARPTNDFVQEFLCELGDCFGTSADVVCEMVVENATNLDIIESVSGAFDADEVAEGLAELRTVVQASHAALLDVCDEDPFFVPADEAVDEALEAARLALDAALLKLTPFFAAVDSLDGLGESWGRMRAEGLSPLVLGAGGLGRSFWKLTIDEESTYGTTDNVGYMRRILPPDTAYELSLYLPERGVLARVSDKTPQGGVRGYFWPLSISNDVGALDSDGDGLTDVVEDIVGSNPNSADSDGDSITDDREIELGTDPNVAEPANSPFLVGGVVAAANTPNKAIAVAASGNTVVVGQKEGVSVFDLSTGKPLIAAQVDSPGNLQELAIDGTRVAAADAGAGLTIVDVGQPFASHVEREVKFTASCLTVVADDGLAFCGLSDGRVVSVHMPTGAVLSTVSLGEEVEIRDLALSGMYLYALLPDSVQSIQVAGGALTLAGEGTATGASCGSSPDFKRLFAGPTALYAVYETGYYIFSIQVPSAPVWNDCQDSSPLFASWRDFAFAGNNLGVALFSPASPTDVDLRPILFKNGPLAKGSIESSAPFFKTPSGASQAVIVHRARALVADNNDGLQVLTYRPYDGAGVAPVVESLTISDSVGPIALNSTEEGKPLCVSVVATDDVQIERVEFLVDGKLVRVDESYPFEIRWVAPLASKQTLVNVAARAVDSGGNVSAPMDRDIVLLADVTEPTVVATIPDDGEETEEGVPPSVVSVVFDEPMDFSTLAGIDGIRMKSSGPDFQIGTPDDTDVVADALNIDGVGRTFFLSFDEPIRADHYSLRIGSACADLVGNRIQAASTRLFTVLGPDSDGDGLFDDFEVHVSGTDPNKADSDGDGIDDGEELTVIGTDPLDSDTDGDGIRDGNELVLGTDPMVQETTTQIIGDVALSGIPVPFARAHIEEAVSGIYVQEADNNGVFVYGDYWPVDFGQVRVEVRWTDPQDNLYFGFSDFFDPVPGDVTNVGTIEIRQVKANEGLEFATCFLPNVSIGGEPSDVELEVWVANNRNIATGKVEVSIPGLGLAWSPIASIAKGDVQKLTFGPGQQVTEQAAMASGLDTVQNVGVLVRSESPVTVHLFNRQAGVVIGGSSDIHTALPRSSLGERYRVVSYPPLVPKVGDIQPSHFAVVASVDGTKVTVVPSVDTVTHLGGEPFEVVLQRLDVLRVVSYTGDLTGSLVVSDKRVSVVAGHQCAAVPEGVNGCDTMVEQLLPTTAWKSESPTVSFAGRIGGDTYRVQNDVGVATVTIDGDSESQFLLGPGDHRELLLDGGARVRSTKPMTVVQLANSTSFDGQPGDPLMLTHAPFERWRDRYVIFSPGEFEANYVNVLIGANALANSELRVDGVAVSPLSFTAVGETSWRWAQLPLSAGQDHVIETVGGNSFPFGAYVYGFSAQESYGYPAGL